MTNERTLTASFVALCSLLFVFATLTGCDKKGAEDDSKDQQTAEKTQKQTEDESAEGEEPGGEAEAPDEKEGEEAPPEGESAETAPEGEPPAEGEPVEAPQPDMKKLEFGDSVEGVLGAPEKMTEEGLEFDTKWYTVEVKKGQTAIFSVEAKNEDGLQPFMTVLLPDDDNKGEWRELDSARAEDGEGELELKMTFKEGGERIITVDDARNIPGPDEARPEEFQGGENFGFTLKTKISPGSAVK